jgi:hypothetical protein
MVPGGPSATANDGKASAGDAAPAGQAAPGRRRLLFAFSLFGVASLAYVFGAAVTFFQLPGSVFLERAFVGARAWYERREAAAQVPDGPLPRASTIATDKPGQTFDGYTLVTYGPGTRAALINMRGEVVHEWQIRFSDIWPAPPHVPPPPRDLMVVFFSTYLYPNGDLLGVMHGPANPANGYGLVKLDKDSHVLWKYAQNVHHDVDVGEDGTIYATRQELIHRPPAGLEFIPTPCMVDYVVMLSAKGEELRSVPILESLRDSPYRPILCALERGERPGAPAEAQRPPSDDDARRRDVLHTNCVKVLTKALAPKFPRFQAGQVLVSMRHLDAVAVMDLASGSTVWAARGPWRAQHDPTFLDNGHLLIFDNAGSPRTSRVLEYDPQTQAFPWSYPADDGPPFVSHERGMSQRLPNGNTLVVNSEGHQVLEVTRDREVVWSCSCPDYVHSARRYSPQQLPFLNGDARARP